MSEEYLRGSEWRKWDLHVKAWCEHGFAAVAITDHFLIDVARINNLRKLAPEITIFPGFEMRTDKAAPNLHIIGIFSEQGNFIQLIIM